MTDSTGPTAQLSKPCQLCRAIGLTLSFPLKTKPIGEFSLAGAQMKVSIEQIALITCDSCGAAVEGHLENASWDDNGFFTGGHFVAHGNMKPSDSKEQ